MKKDVQVAFKAPLHNFDTETQTYSCRANNPDICKNNGISEICAFEREDNI